MLIELPRRLDRTSVNELMSLVIDEDRKPKSKELIFDFSQLGFIEPAGITSLGNLFEWLEIKKHEATIFYPKEFGHKRHCPIKYLDDSGFFLKHLGYLLDESSRVRPTTIQLQNITYDNSYSWLKGKFIPWLSEQIKVKEKTLASIDICIGEIFNNIRDHSFEKIGCIYAQHFPNKNILTFSISDFGVGIPHNIRKVKTELNDAEALELSVQEGFTTGSTKRNLGAGLHTLIMSVVNKSKGSIHIHSGFGILNANYVNDSIKITTSLSSGYYPGTFLDVNIDTSIIIEEDQHDDQEVFVW